MCCLMIERLCCLSFCNKNVMEAVIFTLEYIVVDLIIQGGWALNRESIGRRRDQPRSVAIIVLRRNGDKWGGLLLWIIAGCCWDNRLNWRRMIRCVGVQFRWMHALLWEGGVYCIFVLPETQLMCAGSKWRIEEFIFCADIYKKRRNKAWDGKD